MGDEKRTNQELSREDGASLVEYTILVALIALVTIGSVRAFGSHLRRGDGSDEHRVNYEYITEQITASADYEQ
jgi:hypothetical protein